MHLRVRPLAATMEVKWNFRNRFRRSFNKPQVFPAARAIVYDSHLGLPALKPRADPYHICRRSVADVVRVNREARDLSHINSIPPVKCPSAWIRLSQGRY